MFPYEKHENYNRETPKRFPRVTKIKKKNEEGGKENIENLGKSQKEKKKGERRKKRRVNIFYFGT